MFTGIITERGTLHSREQQGSGARLCFAVEPGFLEGCSEGDSIAVSGVCLTAVNLEINRFSADVSVETLAKTTLGSWREGQRANLEKSLRAADRLGGHMVSGHVDGRGRLKSERKDGQARLLEFEMPAVLAKYVAVKGSICVDGVSLTVNAVHDSAEMSSEFTVCIIPHTLEVTSLGQLEPGDEVNLEVDMIARYLERLRAERA
jgi:riboflavin synthase